MEGMPRRKMLHTPKSRNHHLEIRQGLVQNSLPPLTFRHSPPNPRLQASATNGARHVQRLPRGLMQPGDVIDLLRQEGCFDKGLCQLTKPSMRSGNLRKFHPPARLPEPPRMAVTVISSIPKPAPGLHGSTAVIGSIAKPDGRAPCFQGITGLRGQTVQVVGSSEILR